MTAASGLPGGTAPCRPLGEAGAQLCGGRGAQVGLRRPRELLEASAQTGQALATRQPGASIPGKRRGARRPRGADDVPGRDPPPAQRRGGSLLAGWAWADQAWAPGPAAFSAASLRAAPWRSPDSALCPLSGQQGPSAVPVAPPARPPLPTTARALCPRAQAPALNPATVTSPGAGGGGPVPDAPWLPGRCKPGLCFCCSERARRFPPGPRRANSEKHTKKSQNKKQNKKRR